VTTNTELEIFEFIDARWKEAEQLAREASGSTVVGSPGHWEPSPAGDEWEATLSEHNDEELCVALRPRLPRPPEPTSGYWGAIVSTRPDQRERDTLSPMAAFRHAALHDPASVLADIAAKRAILAEHEQVPVSWPYDATDPKAGCKTCHVDTLCGLVNAEGLCQTVRLLAMPHNAHPGYKPEWAPLKE
jgi:hypothetical protein